MIHSWEIWEIFQLRTSKGKWIKLTELYQIIQTEGRLEEDDWIPSAPGNREPKWKRNVRNVLQKKKADGKVRWKHPALYMF
jgi:hypothetical protein